MANPLAKLSKKTRLHIAICLAGCFFVAEVSVGFYTRSLALIADAFHVLFDLLSFSIALAAIVISEKNKANNTLSFGWQRAQLLGSFFNGVFQLALGFSISLLSLERFITIEKVQNPKLVLIIACAGLGSNIISGIFLGVHEHSHGNGVGELDLEVLKPHEDLGHRHHIKPEKQKWWKRAFAHSHEHNPDSSSDHSHEVAEHGHSHGHSHSGGHAHHDLGTKAVLIHVMGDAFNNLGVIVAAMVLWKAKSDKRYYADPAVSMVIGLVLIMTALKLVWQGGQILLQSAPIGVDVEDVKHDLEKVPGVISVHELHVWRLTEQKSFASAHIVIADPSLDHFQAIAKTMNECLHAYGIHSATIQPEIASSGVEIDGAGPSASFRALQRRSIREASGCEIHCGSRCEEKSCCG